MLPELHVAGEERGPAGVQPGPGAGGGGGLVTPADSEEQEQGGEGGEIHACSALPSPAYPFYLTLATYRVCIGAHFCLSVYYNIHRTVYKNIFI